ncbi:uncharacterized [Tachysurus ichikawai]
MSWVGSEAGWAEAASEGFQADCEAVRGPGSAIAGIQAAVMEETHCQHPTWLVSQSDSLLLHSLKIAANYNSALWATLLSKTRIAVYLQAKFNLAENTVQRPPRVGPIVGWEQYRGRERRGEEGLFLLGGLTVMCFLCGCQPVAYPSSFPSSALSPQQLQLPFLNTTPPQNRVFLPSAPL